MSELPGERKTHENDIRLLEDLFLVRRLPAWGRALASRTIKSPKLHVLDSGLAAFLLGLSPAKVATDNASASTEFGHVVDVVMGSRSDPLPRLVVDQPRVAFADVDFLGRDSILFANLINC